MSADFTDGICGMREPVGHQSIGFVCNLARGHSGKHEAWGIDQMCRAWTNKEPYVDAEASAWD